MMGNGRKPRIDPGDPRMVALAHCAQQCAMALRHHHPLMEPKKAAQIAQLACGFQLNEAPKLLEVYTSKKHSHWGVRLVRPGLVGAPEGLQVIAPLRLEDCTSLEDTMRCATVLALLHDPVVRALLHAQDNHVQFFVGDAEPAEDTTSA